MPTIIRCPNPKCGRKLTVPSASLGNRLRCPACNQRFTLPADPPAPEEEEPPRKPAKRRPVKRDEEAVRESRPRPAREKEPDEKEAVREPRPRPAREKEQDEEPRRKRRRKRQRPAENKDAQYAQAGWRKVSWGFFLCILSIWMWIGEIVLGIVGVLGVGGIGFAMLRPGGAGSEDAESTLTTLAGLGAGLVLLFVLVNLLSFLASVTNLVGQFFCASVPADQGNLQTIAILTFALSATATLVTWGWQIFSLVSSGFQGSIWAALPMSGGGGWLGLIVDIMQFAAEVCWFRLLSGVALEAHNERLAHQINLFLVSCLGLAFGSCLFIPCSFFLIFKLIPDQPGIGFGVVFVLIVLVLVGLVAWYILLLYKVRGSVLKLLRRAEKATLKGA